jgi:DNA-binding SARP family transcriptional activator
MVEHGFDITKLAGSMPESVTDTRTATAPGRHRDSEPTAPEPADIDPAFTAPRPRPHTTPTTPTPDPTPATPAPEARGDIRSVQPLRHTELEVIATAETPVVTDAQLEIIGPRPAPELGAGPCPGQAPWRPSDDTATTTTSATAESATPENAGLVVVADTKTRTAVNDTVEDGTRAAVPIWVGVLGAPRVIWQPDTADMADAREVTKTFQPRTRELLVFLALHPHGAGRESLVAALWPHTPSERTTNALNTTLSRLRRSVSTATGGALSEIVLAGENRYRLDPQVLDVDFWHFDTAVTARRAATTDQQRVDAYRAIVDSYGGALADGMSTEWIETAREAIRRDAIDAVTALARALVDDDPQQTLDLLEIARAFDPHNEALYRDIMRLQERLGLIDAIPRTLSLLTARLAEIDDRPTEQAIGLAARLRQRHNDGPSVQPKAVVIGGAEHSATG